MIDSIIITGISGQDGSLLAKLLNSGVNRIIGLTRSPDHFPTNLRYLGLDNIYLEKMPDSFHEWVTLLEKYRPVEIYNFASQSSVGLSFDAIESTFDSNFIIFHQMLDAVKFINSEIKIFQASSSEMFGNQEKSTFDENSPFYPVSPYALSKVMAHNLANFYRSYSNMKIYCGIFFNHESCLRGKNFVIKKIINHVANLELGFRVNEKLQLGNLNIRRDWGYAPEYMEAAKMIMSSDRPSDYIISSGISSSIEEVVELAFLSIGRNWRDFVIVNKALYRANEINVNCGNHSKLKHEFSWNYNMSLQEFVNNLLVDEISYIEWQKRN